MKTKIFLLIAMLIGGCAFNSNYISNGNVNIGPKLLRKAMGIYWYSNRKIETVESCIDSSAKEFNAPENPAEFDACYIVTTNNSASTLEIESIVWEKNEQYYESLGTSNIIITTR